ncbi:hypothetical protein LINGRAHAP2_LOCUS20367 [Linum grandiflorum]
MGSRRWSLRNFPR